MTVILNLTPPKFDDKDQLLALLHGAPKTLDDRRNTWGEATGPIAYGSDQEQEDEEIVMLLEDARAMIKKLSKPTPDVLFDATDPKQYASLLAQALKLVVADCDEALAVDGSSKHTEGVKDQASDTIYKIRKAMGLSENDMREVLKSLKC